MILSATTHRLGYGNGSCRSRRSHRCHQLPLPSLNYHVSGVDRLVGSHVEYPHAESWRSQFRRERMVRLTWPHQSLMAVATKNEDKTNAHPDPYPVAPTQTVLGCGNGRHPGWEGLCSRASWLLQHLHTPHPANAWHVRLSRRCIETPISQQSLVPQVNGYKWAAWHTIFLGGNSLKITFVALTHLVSIGATFKMQRLVPRYNFSRLNIRGYRVRVEYEGRSSCLARLGVDWVDGTRDGSLESEVLSRCIPEYTE